jgi:AcrR family transcriptional regulator
MGRPKEHGDAVREALLDAAEYLIAAGGPEAVSVRSVAESVGTTTRAVYSVFGSKNGLLGGLAQRAYELLGADIAALPATDDPGHDLVEAAVRAFRAMAITHPSLFRVTFLRVVPELDVGEGAAAARQRSFTLLLERVARLELVGGLGGRTVLEAAFQFNALCEGLAVVEHRTVALLGDDPEQAWRNAIATLVAGFASPAPGRHEGT